MNCVACRSSADHVLGDQYCCNAMTDRGLRRVANEILSLHQEIDRLKSLLFNRTLDAVESPVEPVEDIEVSFDDIVPANSLADVVNAALPRVDELFHCDDSLFFFSPSDPIPMPAIECTCGVTLPDVRATCLQGIQNCHMCNRLGCCDNNHTRCWEKDK